MQTNRQKTEITSFYVKDELFDTFYKYDKYFINVIVYNVYNVYNVYKLVYSGDTWSKG